jgi:hypothetical protein
MRRRPRSAISCSARAASKCARPKLVSYLAGSMDSRDLVLLSTVTAMVID